MDDLRLWAPALASIVAIITAAWSVLSSPARLAIERIAAVSDHVEAMDRRLAHVETELEHMPTKDQMYQLALSIEGMRGEMRGVQVELSTVGETSRRLQAWLLEQGK